jgi:hypothetical protein
VPTKATWLRFETDGDFAFSFFLAEKLGCTVADLTAKISQREYMQWSIWYGRRAQQRELARRGG